MSIWKFGKLAFIIASVIYANILVIKNIKDPLQVWMGLTCFTISCILIWTSIRDYLYKPKGDKK